MRVLDLFCGASGGWSLGLTRAGHRTVAACELDDWRRSVFAAAHPGCRMYADVRELTAERLRADLGYLPEVVVGSPPCQEISAANTKGEGITDDHLFWDWARLVFEIRPVWCAAENSPRARTEGIDDILNALGTAGYAAWPCVVGADHAGANHERRRLWLVAADAAGERFGEGRARVAAARDGRQSAGRDHGYPVPGPGDADVSDAERDELRQQSRRRGGTNGQGAAVAGDFPQHAASGAGLRLGGAFPRCAAVAAQVDLHDDPHPDSDGRGARIDPPGRESWPRSESHVADADEVDNEGAAAGAGEERSQAPRRRPGSGLVGFAGPARGHAANANGTRHEIGLRLGSDDGAELPAALRDIGFAWPHWNGGLAGLSAACAAAGFGAVDDGADALLAPSLRNRAIAALGDAVIPQIPEAIGRAFMSQGVPHDHRHFQKVSIHHAAT